MCGKNVDLLLASCFIARLLFGARTTSCKSAKDRTSVFQTLEVARQAEVWGWLDSAQEQAVLDDLRGIEGVRLRNCEANVGKPFYSFNPLQVSFIPSPW
jgi:inositol polyphosphate-4-phosphatase